MTSLAEVVEESHVVVCCGSGGVGKTTTAAVIAMQAALRGRRSVVITIDPARRLADALGIDSLTNTPSPIEGLGGDTSDGSTGRGAMWAMMLDTKATFDGLVQRYSADSEQAERILANSFYRNIAEALSGTQEYMASEKLYELAIEGDYDLVVVDTPPTRNALDFIESPKRLARFLDHRVYRVLVAPTRGIVKAANVAAQALTRSIAKVVGAEVIGDAIAFFAAFEGMESGFKDRANSVDELLRAESTAFILVAAPNADTVAEAGYFASKLGEHGIDVRSLIVNRMQPSFAGRAAGDTSVSGGAAAARARAESLEGTDIGQMYTALADARQLAQGEEGHLVGLANQVAPAPVVRVPVLPFEVSDLPSLAALGEILFAQDDD